MRASLSNNSQLKIYNSLTRSLDVFEPANKRVVSWYSCGPTVYDVSHLGHARCYICFDIIRRIMSDYFGYSINYVMNITDIDDKIIKRARSNHLFEKFLKSYSDDKLSNSQLLIQVEEALQEYISAMERASERSTNDEDLVKVEMMKGTIDSSKAVLEELKQAVADSKPKCHNLSLLRQLKDVISEFQDKKLGHSVTDHRIFKALATKYEEEFFEDMRMLNVLPPDSSPRVSDYIEEIGLYIKRLEANGFAYRTGGSVYFATDKFNSDPKHKYAKLVPEAYGHDSAASESSEGELAPTDAKRSKSDFALWKKSKPGEPSWKLLDLEEGRPGWHIECSVMAGSLLGENFDIHSGGCDLKFPHHDNEIAQAEAYYNTGRNWVNFFLHSGHLSISGCKMSKSLKNFVTIRQALQRHTARQLRISFLLHRWTGGLDYSEQTLDESVKVDKKFREFFTNVAYVTWSRGAMQQGHDGGQIESPERRATSDDDELLEELRRSKELVDQALCDNFDTPSAVRVLLQLVKECNKRPDCDVTLLREVCEYIMSMLKIFGADYNEDNSETTKTVFSYVRAMAQFRSDVRRLTKDKEVLALCDSLRDKILPDLGVKLEDREGDGALFKVRFVDAEELAAEKENLEKEKRLKEEKAKAEKLRLQQQREEKMRIPPSQMFRNQLEKYSKFDESGMPTHDNTGKEISIKALKKLERLYKEQELKYKRYLEAKQEQ